MPGRGISECDRLRGEEAGRAHGCDVRTPVRPRHAAASMTRHRTPKPAPNRPWTGSAAGWRSRGVWTLTLIATLALPAPACADATPREAMADAMSRMMEAMGFLSSGTDTARAMAGGQMGMGSMPGMGMPWGGMPWGGPGTLGMPGWPGASMPWGGSDPMSQAERMGETMMGQMPSQMRSAAPSMPAGMPWTGAWPGAMPWAGSLLEGVWEGASGGALIVQGPFYRLYSATGGFVDGRIETTDGSLRLYNTVRGFDLRFDLALDQGRMALRDDHGQVYLYRRLVLDGGETADPQPSAR